MDLETQVGGTVVGRFRIERVLGRGGMATVFAAFDERRAASVALKVLKRELTRDPMVVRRFEREAKAASHLRHPNVIEILEWGVQGEEAFIAMELASGLDLLRALSQERPMRQSRAVLILAQVCAALTAAHAKGIVHRDLKPENILLVSEPEELGRERAKVLDFGIAKILDLGKGAASGDDPPSYVTKTALTRVGTIVGTPAYMSPEQCRGGDIDGRSDIYACGVLLYQLVTGELPFSGETPLHTAMRHIHAQPRNPSELRRGLSPAIERTILKALSKWPGERQQTAEQLREELYAALPTLPDRGDLVIPAGFSGKSPAASAAPLDRSAAVTTGGLGTTPLRRVQLHRVTNPPPSEEKPDDPLKTEPESPSVNNAPPTEPKSEDDDEPRTFLREPDPSLNDSAARATHLPDTELATPTAKPIGPATEPPATREPATRAPVPRAEAGRADRPAPGTVRTEGQTPPGALGAEATAASPRPSGSASRPSAAPARNTTNQRSDVAPGPSRPTLETRRPASERTPTDPRSEAATPTANAPMGSSTDRAPVKATPARKAPAPVTALTPIAPSPDPPRPRLTQPNGASQPHVDPRSASAVALVPTETAETGLTPTALRDVPSETATSPRAGSALPAFVTTSQEVDDDEPATFIRDLGPPNGPAVVKTLVMDEPRLHAIELAGAAAQYPQKAQPSAAAAPASGPAPAAPPSQHGHAGRQSQHSLGFASPSFGAPTQPVAGLQPAQPLVSGHMTNSANAAVQNAQTLPAPNQAHGLGHATAAPHARGPASGGFHQSGSNPVATGFSGLSDPARMSEGEPGVKSTVRLNPQETMAAAAQRGATLPSGGWNESTVARSRSRRTGVVGQIDTLSGSTGMLIGIGLGLAFAAVGLALALILFK